MGSLMAGWDSPAPDPRVEKYRRTKSLTREEIKAFWKSKKSKEEEHLRDLSFLSPRSQKVVVEEAEGRGQGASGRAVFSQADKFLGETSPEKLIKQHGWWTSSNWAFLNEPPVIDSDAPRHSYTSQFHVANVDELAGSSQQDGVGA